MALNGLTSARKFKLAKEKPWDVPSVQACASVEFMYESACKVVTVGVSRK